MTGSLAAPSDFYPFELVAHINQKRLPFVPYAKHYKVKRGATESN